MTERVHDPAIAVAPELVGQRHQRHGTGGQRPVPPFVSVIDLQMQGKAPGHDVRLIAMFGKLIRQHDQATVDQQATVQQPLAVFGQIAQQLLGPEGRLIEFDGRLAAAGGTVFFGLFNTVSQPGLALLYASTLFLPAALLALILPEPLES